MSAPAAPATAGAFAVSTAAFERLVAFLEDEAAGALEHGALEEHLQLTGREVLRLMFQDHLDLRALKEQRIAVVCDAEGRRRGSVEPGHSRVLGSVFGKVKVTRLAYRQRGVENLCPSDGELNLPVESYSHGLRRLAAVEASRGSFEQAGLAIGRATCQGLGKRQIEELAARAAQDFHGFYEQRERAETGPEHVLVLSCDGKGVVMRHQALRPQTQKLKTSAKLKTRLSRGEKRNRKRMAEVGAVYEIFPSPRTSRDILPDSDSGPAARAAGPLTLNKWLTASVIDNTAQVIGEVFQEADRRDPARHRRWIALVDGNAHQIKRIQAEAQARNVDIAIVCDFVHVIEYLWKAAWCLHPTEDPAAEAWVQHHARQILDGRATHVAGQICGTATRRRLTPQQRTAIDICARYLRNNRQHMDYPAALTQGWPIATGVIEGACRHLVKDRMDITGARWGLPGAEAILKLRAIRTNDDLDEYWTYHLAQEHQRVHRSRYIDDQIPVAA